MTGLIWFVQIVHYPLFASVPEGAFAPFHRRHMRLTTRVVAPLMLLEMFSAVALLFAAPTPTIRALAATGLALLAGIWLSTWAVQVPDHQKLRLTQGNPRVTRGLVRANWVRTGGWSLRCLISAALVVEIARASF